MVDEDDESRVLLATTLRLYTLLLLHWSERSSELFAAIAPWMLAKTFDGTISHIMMLWWYTHICFSLLVLVLTASFGCVSSVVVGIFSCWEKKKI
jgi:hypothetical protein